MQVGVTQERNLMHCHVDAYTKNALKDSKTCTERFLQSHFFFLNAKSRCNGCQIAMAQYKVEYNDGYRKYYSHVIYTESSAGVVMITDV